MLLSILRRCPVSVSVSSSLSHAVPGSLSLVLCLWLSVSAWLCVCMHVHVYIYILLEYVNTNEYISSIDIKLYSTVEAGLTNIIYSEMGV